jgi:hypothetical protein
MLLPWFKVFKILAVAGLFTGAIGACITKAARERSIFAYYIYGPSFALAWAMGLFLTFAEGIELFSWWLLGSIALSLLSLNAVLYVAGKDDRATRISVPLAIAPLVISVVLMITKPK